MRLGLICWLLGCCCLLGAEDASERAILEVIPTVRELGKGWTTNIVAYLLDPRSRPSEIDYRVDVQTSLLLDYQRSVMRTNHRTGCCMVLFGRGDLVNNSGLFRVFIQRWDNRRSLHNGWVGYKMVPGRVLRTTAHVGEDYFWSEEWWRRTLVRQNLVFRRGLFHVAIEAGAESDPLQLLRLAQVIDAKIRGRPTPPEESSPP